MPKPKQRPNPLNPDGECPSCGQRHLTRTGRVACSGHVTKHRADETGYRAPLDQPRPCTQPSMRGLHVCAAHGGKAGHAKKAGEQRMAEDKLASLAKRWSVPIDTTPTDAILGRVSAFAGHVKFYGEMVAALEDDAMTWGVTKETEGDVVVGVGANAMLDKAEGVVREAKPNVWIQLYNDASDRLVKFAGEALRAGVEERRVRLAEAQGALVADVLRAVAARLKLTPEQMAEFAKAAPEELRRLYAA